MPSTSKRAGERGVALLIAVVATALLTVTVLEFTYSSQVAYRRAAHWLDAERARLAAESGMALAAEVLSFDGELQELIAGQKIPDSLAPTLQGLDPRLAAVDGAIDLWARCSEPGPWTCNQKIGMECTLPLGVPGADTSEDTGSPPGFFTVRIDDEAGLYNLNRLTSERAGEADRVAKLFLLAGVDASLVGPIADWVDKDAIPFSSPPGAEASQYAAEGREVPPRNLPLQSFRELGLVLGVDAEALRKLRPLTTAIPIVAAANEGDININTAPLPVLQSLSPQFDDESLLMAVQAQRCVRPFIDKEDLVARVPAIAAAGTARFTYKTSWFRVRSTAHVGDSVQSVEALLSRTGKNIVPVYLLAQRGANIAVVDTPPTAGFDVSTPPELGDQS